MLRLYFLSDNSDIKLLIYIHYCPIKKIKKREGDN